MRGAVHVEGVLGFTHQAAESGRESVDESALARPDAWIFQALGEHSRAQAVADETLVEIFACPAHEALVDWAVEGGQQLGDPSGRRDDHHDHDLRLQCQDLDVTNGRGVQRRRRDHRQQTRDLGDRHARDAHRLLDLAARQRKSKWAVGDELAACSEHPVDDVAMTGLSWHAPRRGVRMGEQIVLLEQRELVAHGRGSTVEARVSRDRLGCDRLSAALVVLHHLAQDQLLSGGEHMSDCRRRPRRPERRPGLRSSVRPRRCE